MKLLRVENLSGDRESTGGALTAAFSAGFHAKYKNVDLFDLNGSDAKISAAIIVVGLIGVTAATTLAVRLPSLSGQ